MRRRGRGVGEVGFGEARRVEERRRVRRSRCRASRCRVCSAIQVSKMWLISHSISPFVSTSSRATKRKAIVAVDVGKCEALSRLGVDVGK